MPKRHDKIPSAGLLGNRTTAVHVPLEDGILVRIQVPQLRDSLFLESLFYFFNLVYAKYAGKITKNYKQENS